jgi:diguanylate cyclase (GGDEF)-like protein/PAS domain S-box-containing protein
MLGVGRSAQHSFTQTERESLLSIADEISASPRGDLPPVATLENQPWRSIVAASPPVIDPLERLALLNSEIAEYRDRLAQRESELAHALEIARLGSWVRDSAGNMTISREAAHILELPDESTNIHESQYFSMVQAGDVEFLKRCRLQALEMRHSYRIDYRVVTVAGAERWIEESVGFSETGKASRTLSGTIQDITERKRLEQRLHELAFRDSLTGLPNRRALIEEVEREIARAGEDEHPFAIMIVDLDRFAVTNDSLGHLVGDQVLKAIAERMERTIGSKAMLGRLGGDEFLVILKSPTTFSEASDACARLLESMTSAVSAEGIEVTVRSSIGIAAWPKHAKTAQELIEAADTAMFAAKHRGGHTMEWYSPELRFALERRRRLEDHLRRALSNQELSLVYQPIFDFRGPRRAIGVEALLRWNSDLGPTTPTEFIPVAEESGLIGVIGWWVLAEACGQGARWLHESGIAVEMGVNVAAAQLRDERFVPDLMAILKRTRFPANLLTLELTERTAFDNDEIVQQTIRQLAELGITIAIDDFGTGYSSLSSLKRLPVHIVKLDRLFVSELPVDQFSRAICESVVTLSHNLGYKVVAEGIETEAQAHFLQSLGVDRAQGYLLAEPMSAANAAELLRKQR